MERLKRFIKCNGELSTIGISMIVSNLLFFSQRKWLMNPVSIAFIAVLFYVGIRNAYKNREFLKEPRVWKGVLILALLFSAMVVVGMKIEVENQQFTQFYALDILWIFFYLAIGGLLFFDLYLLSENAKITTFFLDLEVKKTRDKNWILYSILLAIAWVPVFLCYYPGIMPEDATCSVAMAIGELPWTNQFPVFYSLMVGAFIFIGYCLNNVNIGIALYSVFQLVVMAGGLGFFLSWLQKKGIKKRSIYFFLAYFSAAPMFGNYAIVMWKDPMFSGLLILLAIFLYDHVVQSRETFLKKKNLMMYSVILILMCLMRTNGIYIGFLINCCLVIIYRQHLKKVIIPLFGSIMLVYLLTGPIYTYFFSAETMFEETVGVPLQQMARTVVTDGNMNEEDREYLNQLLPIEKYEKYYNPFLVDPIKWAPEFNSDYLEAHKKEFFETWGSMLTKNFGEYVKQYLMGTYGFWHIGGDTNYEFVKEEVSENTWNMYQSSPWETIFNYPMKENLNRKYDYLPTGLLTWIMLYNMVLCWMKKKSMYMIPFLVVFGNWLTLMVATPTAFGVRYVFVSVLAFPLLLIYQWMIPKRKEAGETKYVQ